MIPIFVDATLLPFENVYINCLYIMTVPDPTSLGGYNSNVNIICEIKFENVSSGTKENTLLHTQTFTKSAVA